MLVYQALLLGGYAYAHQVAYLRPRRQAGLHLALLAVAALWLPIGLTSAMPPPDVPPALWAPWFLVSSIGPLFFIISAQAPLMQRWYALETARGEPYSLYAASNLGSFAGLLSYPLLVEPLLTLKQQSALWTGGFALLVLLVVGCALTIPAQAVERQPVATTPRPTRRRVIQWVLLAAVPSGLMLSTTTHLTTDIIAMPLLWVLPLGLYLLSFVGAFATRRGLTEFLTQLAPLIILIAGGLAFAEGSRHPLFSATLGLSLLFVVAVTLHGEMYRLRPAPDHLTAFYLAMSMGGVIGGLFCAILAPTMFDWTYEHPLLILAAALLLPQRSYLRIIERIWAQPGPRRTLSILLPAAAFGLSLLGDNKFYPSTPAWAPIAVPVLIGLMALFAVGQRAVFAACLAALMLSYGGWFNLQLTAADVRTRSYFGVYMVGNREGGRSRVLTHGTTIHGVQNLSPGQQLEPTTYYVRKSGVGQAMAALETLYGPGARAGVIGLGTGTLACYAVPGQKWTFFEIDPQMVGIAKSRFSFLSGCTPDARIVLGDARLTLARQLPASFNAIAVDAFSSDAVPMHLLTHEALAVYGRALTRDGLLLVHISNRYLDLEPVIAAGAAKGGWEAVMLRYSPDARAAVNNATPSVWIAMSRDKRKLDDMIAASDAKTMWWALEPRKGFGGWTDDFASILPLLKDWTN